MKFRIILLALALSACNQNTAKPTGGTAGGEILPGSTSDAMLPLDTVRSQPPLAPKVESSGRPADKGARSEPAVSRSSAPAAEAPAASPEPVEEPAEPAAE